MKIYYHPRFERSYRKLPFHLRAKAEARETLFRENPFDARLDTHKLHGKLKRQWSFSVDGKCRILFDFIMSDVVFIDVGDNDIYR
ncbi:MAG: type II toxin-antitoxin system mRNA interferase toxin, RelE/StbE family [Candidatus Liptonbacteria bacterium]|nr:type II toxin-antitoxin system mRNA interferase toxin, RelE/StbE family [Candidatus Liptonbacteria bacterium]